MNCVYALECINVNQSCVGNPNNKIGEPPCFDKPLTTGKDAGAEVTLDCGVMPLAHLRSHTIHSWKCTRCNFENKSWFLVEALPKTINCQACKLTHKVA